MFFQFPFPGVIEIVVFFQFPFPGVIEIGVFFQFHFPGMIENAVFFQFPFPGVIENTLIGRRASALAAPSCLIFESLKIIPVEFLSKWKERSLPV